MHYTAGGAPITTTEWRKSLHRRIRENVISAVPENTWRETTSPLPLRHNTDPWTIALECLRFCNGSLRTNAVYILECLHNSAHQHSAAVELGKPKPEWVQKVSGADRLIYVGVTANLLRRLDQHLNNTDNRAAQFTRVFPPIRVLNLSWYSSYPRAARAEVLTAELLRERFPGDYVSQPG